MSEELVTVASFLSPLAAQIALGQLGDEGIQAVSSGDLSAAAFAGIDSLGGPVQIQVHASDVPRAREIIAALEGEPDPEWENETEKGVWLCSICGEAITPDRSACPSCQTPRDAIRTKNTTPLIQQQPPKAAKQEDGIARRDQVRVGAPVVLAQDLLEESEPLAYPETFVADDVARRAFRSAIFGCMTIAFLFNIYLSIAFLFTIYSFWLCFRLCLLPGELSPQSSTRLRWAFLLNFLVMFTWALRFQVLRVWL